jgi:tellurite resistance protein TerB
MQWFADFKASAAKKISQFKNSTFKDGVLSAAALIVAADGKVEASERAKVVKFVGSSELLASFDAGDLGSQFNDALSKAEDEFKRIDLLRAVGKLKGSDGADTAMRVVLILANADGVFDDSEKRVAREIAAALGLKADDYLAA